MAFIDLLGLLRFRLASKDFLFIVASPLQGSFRIVSSVLMPCFNDFMELD